MAKQVWGQRGAAWEDQAGAAFAHGQGDDQGLLLPAREVTSWESRAYLDDPGYEHQMLIELGQQLRRSFCCD